MKVYLACYQSVVFVHGGPYVAIIEMKHHLEKLGVDVSYFNMWSPKDYIYQCDFIHLFGTNLGIYNLVNNLKDRNIRFVVTPIFYTRHSVRMIRLADAAYTFGRRFVRGLRWDWNFSKNVCQWAEVVIPNTHAEAKLIEKGFRIPNEKIRTIPNGVSEKFLSADPSHFQKKYGLKDFILFVGHIGPDRKNVLSLMRALHQIDCPAVIIGQVTPSREAEMCLKEAEKNKNLIIIDGIDHGSSLLASAYAGCHVFALPSKFETPGIAALEAALTGANIVITPHGGTKEYLLDYAEYVNPYSVKSIRMGIEKALNKPKTESLKHHIQKHFLWSHVAKNMLKVYQSVAKG